SVEGDGHKFKPWGFQGGAEGLPSALVQVGSAGDGVELPSKVPYRKAKAGDRLVSYGPSGGGYGDPLLRAPEAVLENVLDGIVSKAQAREQYGVVIAAESVDSVATEALRAELRRVRTARDVGANARGR
ncbi:MAG TPA: hydantoinase B/oxoprolinase family protein, partial [Roseiarcus sp.]|nr:hydantoinase B/oxoprolinase family protein [Roseiarcus sp.]